MLKYAEICSLSLLVFRQEGNRVYSYAVEEAFGALFFVGWLVGLLIDFGTSVANLVELSPLEVQRR